MPTPRFSIRVDPVELKRWKKQAKAEGLDVSAWIRSRCSAPPAVPADDLAGLDNPTLAAARRNIKRKPTPAASVCPPHPKAARTVLNAGLGIKRCGACGDTVRT